MVVFPGIVVIFLDFANYAARALVLLLLRLVLPYPEASCPHPSLLVLKKCAILHTHPQMHAHTDDKHWTVRLGLLQPPWGITPHQTTETLAAGACAGGQVPPARA